MRKYLSPVDTDSKASKPTIGNVDSANPGKEIAVCFTAGAQSNNSFKGHIWVGVSEKPNGQLNEEDGICEAADDLIKENENVDWLWPDFDLGKVFKDDQFQWEPPEERNQTDQA